MSDDEGVSRSQFSSFLPFFLDLWFECQTIFQLFFLLPSADTADVQNAVTEYDVSHPGFWLTILIPKVSRRTPSSCESNFSSFLPSSFFNFKSYRYSRITSSSSAKNTSSLQLTSTGNQCPRHPQTQGIRYRYCTRYRSNSKEESSQDQGKLMLPGD